MNTTPPLLPEATFAPLPALKLESMIDHALTHQQLPQQDNVVAFRPRSWQHNLMFGSSMAAMAASIMLTFMLIPQMDSTSVASVQTTTSSTADLSDMLLLDTLGA